MRVTVSFLICLCACGEVSIETDAGIDAEPPTDVGSGCDGCLGFDAPPFDARPTFDAYVADAPPPDAAGFLRVFITTAVYSPTTIGGLAGGDVLCNAEASAAGLGGTWMAWLASTTAGPATRFTTQSSSPYRRLDDVVVANSWADLVDGTIAADISVTPTGPVANGNNAWSNVAVDGTPVGSNNCGNWADSTALSGHYGRGNSSTATWTDSGNNLVCGNYSLHLYCFEQ